MTASRPNRRLLAHPAVVGLAIALLAALIALVLVVRERRADAVDRPVPGMAGTAAQRIEADVRFLADDLLEGREAGTRGYQLASLYVAERMRAIGLEPGGEDGSYFQRVPLLRAQRLADGGELRIERDGAVRTLRFREDFLPALNYNAADARITAPAVFVGQGVNAPSPKHDDFRGVDLSGKIAVLFAGAPAKFDNDRRAFYSSTREKLAELVRRGAVGAVFVATDEDEKRRPWARGAADWDQPGMRLRGPDGRGIDTFPQLRVVTNVNAASAAALLGRDPAPLFKAVNDGTLAPFELPGTLTLAARTQITADESRNVVGRLPGSHRTLAAEHVAFTAHLDHVGIGTPVDGDAIYNGALDNALGIGIMLEAARELAARPVSPRRSSLFIALTAEEKGLLGAEWFASHPTVPRESIVANVNMDMPILLTPTTDVIPIGIEHSTLQPIVERAAREVGVELSPDPFPEQVVFVRSDQYAFIRAGIPAVYLDGGMEATQRGIDGKAALQGFLDEHYHEPSDEADQPIQYRDAARLARLNARIGELIGNGAQRPRWNAGDFFGERFAPKSAPAQ
ncbi:M28 family metallopeptidase [Lysobacter korlensis]|uniref:M28 family metallopeptidase n=1 Tax=Lysobacter korlensis TaxID=553636 RepID=A0ABV6RHF9_9GAMM